MGRFFGKSADILECARRRLQSARDRPYLNAPLALTERAFQATGAAGFHRDMAEFNRNTPKIDNGKMPNRDPK